MNKKILIVAIILLVAGTVVAVLVSRSPKATPEADAPGAEGTAAAAARVPQSNPGSAVARSPGRQPAADPGGPRSAENKTDTPTLTEDQKDRIVRLCRQAGKAYVAAEHQKALTLANQALDMDANNEFALRIAGASACMLNMQSNAQVVYNRLPSTSSARNLLVSVCARKGITLATVPRPAPEPGTSPAAGPSASGFTAAGDKPEGVPKKLSSTAVSATIKKVRKEIEHCTKSKKGLVRVRMTVEGSGKVTSAAIMGEHAKSPTGACIKEVMLKMTFPPFTGPPRTFIFPFITR